MLRLDGVRLGQGNFAVTADWAVPAGAKVALIGPSGAGKSTLLLGVAGFIPVAQGRLSWEGRDLGPLAPPLRPVSILFQDQNLFPHLTIAQNLGLALSPDLRLTAAHWAQVDGVLDRLGLNGLGARRPGALSGGQMARAALGRVLLQARPVVLLDEPFAALGPGLKADLLALVAEVAAEATVLLVTHDPRDARHFADLSVLVADGVAAAPVATAALFADPPAALRSYLGEGFG
jgi:thiamine transport system ATP-binding protein